MQKLTPQLLSEERLIKSVDPETYQIGLKLYKNARVTIQELKEQKAVCSVEDNREHLVEIQLTSSHLLLKCDCPHGSRGLVCEHGVACWLFVRDHLSKNDFPQWRNQLNRILETNQADLGLQKGPPFLLFFCLLTNQNPLSREFHWAPYVISFHSLDKQHQEQLTNISPDDIQNILKNSGFLKSKLRPPQSLLKLDGCLNQSQQMVILANLMIHQQLNQQLAYSFDELFHLFAETETIVFLGDVDNPLDFQVRIISEPGELSLSIAKDKQGISLYPKLQIGKESYDLKEHSFIPLYPSHSWGLSGNLIFPVKNVTAIEAFLEISKHKITIPDFQEKDFLDKYFLDLARLFKLEGELVEYEEIYEAPIPRLYLSDNAGEIQVQLRYGYAGSEVLFDSTYPDSSQIYVNGTWKFIQIQRDPDAEENYARNLASAAYGLKRAPLAPQPGIYRLRARTHPVDFLLHRLPRLVKDGFEIYGEEQLKTARVNRQKPTISFSVASEIDWFDVQAIINFGDLEVSLKDIRRAVKKNERFVKLADGSIGEIPEEWLEKYRSLLGLAESSEKGFRFSQHQLALIEDMLASADHKSTDAVYEQKRQAFEALSQPGFPGVPEQRLPLDFQGELRPYQKAGYDWLHFLRQYQLGGCLADDMGLGKTIQALVFLQSIYSKPALSGSLPATSLLVVPKSLLVNWQREAARFTPQLRIKEYFATNRNRDLSEFQETDLVITTYGVMLRDISHLLTYRFEYIILDESQAIKNPASQTARAVRLLQSKHKLVMTGTPVENSTIELWSQFAFLNPGLLGNLDYFKAQFASPIERKNDAKVLSHLRRMIFPFIMRRTKDQVAPELPPRTERILTCDMEPAQRKLYNRTRDFYRGMLLGLINSNNLQTNQMKILEGLLRLRQISIHPRLVDEKFRGDSGKYLLLLDTLQTLHAEGHKVLVFSQFVKMLSLVREDLEHQKVPYTYLDGQTQNRQEQVDMFQENMAIPFFLISLKAGGVGLNLTAADYVIHIDPWWNPAVEMQASDRTHRIGQDKPVFVFKMITQESVEEKILTLQERKKNLVDQLITTESSFVKSLTAEDIQILFS